MLADLAIAWVLTEPAVASVIAGASKVKHIIANARAVLWKLGQEEVTEIQAILGDKDQTWEKRANLALPLWLVQRL